MIHARKYLRAPYISSSEYIAPLLQPISLFRELSDSVLDWFVVLRADG